jgi:hypothetical protein
VEAGFEVTGPQWERKGDERVIGCTPSSQPAGSRDTTGTEGVLKIAWQRSWWPKQEPKIFIEG